MSRSAVTSIRVYSWISIKFKIQIHLLLLQSITNNTSVVQNIFFNNGCKGDPQKALLKAAFMRATIYCFNYRLASIDWRQRCF